jgi:hypothetical protein
VRRPSQQHHVGPDRGLVEENQTLGLDAVLRHSTPALCDVGRSRSLATTVFRSLASQRGRRSRPPDNRASSATSPPKVNPYVGRAPATKHGCSPEMAFRPCTSASVPDGMLNQDRPDLGIPNRTDLKPSCFKDRASGPTQSERRLWQHLKKNVSLPIDGQPSTKRGTRIVLLTCGTSRA